MRFQPTWLDRQIIRFAPQRGLRRLQSRLACSMFSYRSADSKPFDRTHIDSAGTGDEQLTEDSHEKQRNLCRQRYRDDVLYAGIVEAFLDNVIFCGFQFQSVSNIARWRKIVESWWTERSEQSIDARGVFDWASLERLLERSRVNDGDLLIVKNDDGTVTLIEGDRLVSPFGNYADPTVVNGVQIDRNGKPVRYHIADIDPILRTVMPTTKPIDADRCIYYGDPLRYTATRTAPILQCTIPLFEKLDQLLEAVNTAAVVSACLAAFVKSAVPFDLGAVKTPSPTDERGNTRRVEDIIPGSITWLDINEEIGTINPAQPSANLPEHFHMLFRMCGRLLGVPLELSLLDASRVNYSSARVVLLEARRAFQRNQQFHRVRGCKAIMRHQLQWAIKTPVAQGGLKGLYAGDAPSDAFAHDWEAPSWDWVDPAKEIDAIIAALDNNLTTFGQVIRGRGTGDVEKIAQIKARELRIFREAAIAEGLPPDALLPAGAKPKPTTVNTQEGNGNADN